MELALAVDIGGTKLEVGLVDDSGQVVTQRRVLTNTRQTTRDHRPSGDELFARLAELISRVVSEESQAPVVCGVGTGGPMEQDGERVSPLNIEAWRGFPLRSRLTELMTELGLDIDVHVDNDAKALALAEGWVGAAAGQSHFMAMVVSTGIGGGIVLEGRLLDGTHGNAGHVGHLVVNPGGRVHVGIAGSLEGEASGTAIEALTGRPAASAGPKDRRRAGVLVGRAAGGVANLLDLRLIVVAGSVALGFGDEFFEAAQGELDQVARLDYTRGARIVPAGLGSAGPLVGAGAVGFRGFGMKLGVIEPR